MKFKESDLEAIRSSWRDVIREIVPGIAQKKVNKEDSYICPCCNHGANGDGLTFIPRDKGGDGNHFKCFGQDCKFNDTNHAPDIIDLYSYVNNTDFVTSVKNLAARLNITLEDGAGEDFSPIRDKTPAQDEKSALNANLKAREASRDFSQYFAECRARISASEAVSYLTGRGFTMENIIRHGVGYDPAADPAEVGIRSQRIIIPTHKGHYIARAIAPDNPIPKLNPKGSSPGIFNYKALEDPELSEVFICESAFDALAIGEAGAEAISINSASNVGKLLKIFEKHPPEVMLVIAAQSDAAGDRASEEIRKGLLRLNIPHITADLCSRFKDPAEFLQYDRENFLLSVEKAVKASAAKPDNIAQYLERDMLQDIADYKTNIHTGFKNLDEELRFLYPGLYVFAAGSGIGKTTFLLQMACQIAEQGKDVLFFSMEQSRLELVAKALSRMAAEKNLDTFVKASNVMNNELNYKEKLEVDAVKDDFVTKIGDHLGIIEGNFRCDVDYICEYVRRFIRRNNSTPVIFLDYLQIIQPSSADKRRGTTKEAIDSVVTDLKRFSREIKSPILAAASINRAAYFAPAETSAIKESGNIEFTADAVFFLQLRVMNRPLFYDGDAIERSLAISAEKKKRPREIDLICRKNRYGSGDFLCYFDYYSRNDLFKGIAEAEEIAKIEKNELESGARKPGRGTAKKDPGAGFVKPETLPTWEQLTAKKQSTFFNLLQGRALDLERKEVELTFITLAGRKLPAVKRGDTVQQLSEEQYKELVEFNKQHLPLYIKLKSDGFRELGEVDSGLYPF